MPRVVCFGESPAHMAATKNRVPSCETERLVLSPVTMADVEAYERHFVDYQHEVWQLSKTDWRRTRERSRGG